MILNELDYRDKVLGCWMGKNIGGTLGAPFEWRRQLNNVSFYTQDLTGEPLPNDDLDIQLLWLVALEERGIDLNARTLSEYWVLYVTPHWSEYGTAKINMRSGLMPPLSGMLHNEYKDSCGAFIRSEIWACIAPGAPHLAARYAYEDAILDHGNGEGVFAEVFCAALESAAFVLADIDALIEIGLSYIPAECGVAGAVRCAREALRGGKILAASARCRACRLSRRYLLRPARAHLRGRLAERVRRRQTRLGRALQYRHAGHRPALWRGRFRQIDLHGGELRRRYRLHRRHSWLHLRHHARHRRHPAGVDHAYRAHHQNRLPQPGRTWLFRRPVAARRGRR